MAAKQSPMGLILVAMALLAVTSPATATVFEGVLLSTSGHNGTAWSIQLANGTIITLPEQPVTSYANHPAPITATIRVNCTIDDVWYDDPAVGVCLDLQPVEVLYTPSAASSAVTLAAFSTSAAGQAGTRFRLVFGIADMTACGWTTPVTEDYVWNSLRNVADNINVCSNGQWSIDLDNSVVTTVTIPCSYQSHLNSCGQPSAVSDPALAQVAAVANQAIRNKLRLSSLNPSVGTLHTGLVVPENAPCPWFALAQVGAPQTWYMPSADGIGSTSTVVQELLHNFKLFHSNRDQGSSCACDGQDNCRCHTEYGDSSTPMGSGDTCINAPEMYFLNWATAVARLDQSSLPVGQLQTFTLPALQTQAAFNTGAMVIVRPTWTTPNRNELYFSLRNRNNWDRNLANEFVGRVSMHRLNAQTIGNGDALVHIVNTFAPSSRSDAGYNIIVQTSPLSSTGTIDITLCRYSRNPSECPTRSTPTQGPPPAMPAPPMPGLPFDGPPPAIPAPPMPGIPSPPSTSPMPIPYPPVPGWPAPPIDNEVCVDTEADCINWAAQGFCNPSSNYFQYMQANCPVACGECGGGDIANNACQDGDEATCADWVSFFGCVGGAPINAQVRSYCPQSCNTCQATTAASAGGGAGQQCVDLSSACATFRDVIGCNPVNNTNATLWVHTNCQATCDLCPVNANGASVNDQLPLGCGVSFALEGATPANVTEAANLTDCWSQCYDTESCFIFTYHDDNSTCELRTNLLDVIEDPEVSLVEANSSTICIVGTNRAGETPEILSWFTCVEGMDVAGSLVAVLDVGNETECAEACNNRSDCMMYTLLNDGSCYLKSYMFSGDYGTTGFNDAVYITCIQTFYQSPDPAAAARRRMLHDGATAETTNLGHFSQRRGGARKMLRSGAGAGMAPRMRAWLDMV